MRKKSKTALPSGLWDQVDRPQLLSLVRSYYAGGLLANDNQPIPFGCKGILPSVYTIERIDGRDVPRGPQGKPLIADVTHEDMDLVIRHVRGVSVNIGGMTVDGWHEYVIRVLLKLEKTYAKKNELLPKVRDSHYQEALTVLGNAFLRCVLNDNLNNRNNINGQP